MDDLSTTTATIAVQQSLQDGIVLRQQLLAQCANHIAQAGALIRQCLARGGTLFFFGNGGSAADAQHLAAEFVGRFLKERHPLPAIALTTDTSALTAIGNDYGFHQIFARQLQALARIGDLAIGLSTSGNSPNVLAAAQMARTLGLKVIGMTGESGGQLQPLTDVILAVPSRQTARVQECHIAIGHILCELAEMEPVPKLRTDSISPNHKITDWSTLLQRREAWRVNKRKVVWTNGCFDLVHVGHIRSLHAAKAFGDILVVGINSDNSVCRLKGPTRPLVGSQDRMELLAALSCVDAVVEFDEDTPVESLLRLKPDVHCKGAEYEPPHGKPVPEAATVLSYGGQIAYLPMIPGISTTALVQRIKAL
jgi:phosphoheptose isomerase